MQKESKSQPSARIWAAPGSLLIRKRRRLLARLSRCIDLGLGCWSQQLINWWKDTGGSAPCESLSWIMVLNSVPIAFMATANGVVNSRDTLKNMA
jgi:hypothetical protein